MPRPILARFVIVTDFPTLRPMIDFLNLVNIITMVLNSIFNTTSRNSDKDCKNDDQEFHLDIYNMNM